MFLGCCLGFDLYLNVFVVVSDMGPLLLSSKKFSLRDSWGGGEGRGSLCVKLLGRSLLIHCSGGFPLTEIVAAFILLSHAVHQEEDEEDGKEKANNSACNDSCKARNKGEVKGSSVRVSPTRVSVTIAYLHRVRRSAGFLNSEVHKMQAMLFLR